MKHRRKILGGVAAVIVAVCALSSWYLSRHAIPVLQPAGQIGGKERNLIIFCCLVSVIVVVPVFTLLVTFAWRYREGNQRAAYDPELSGNGAAETIWWLVPTAIIAVISVVTWRSSYALDPFKPLNGGKTVHVQVVALDWKWLFIYPDRHLASTKVAYIPANTPVEFDITSDAVMTSFWVPSLGGQMYAMPGMSTKLNLRADKVGSYDGTAANISGKGFADMTFKVVAVPRTQYAGWMHGLSEGPVTQPLTMAAYNQLARPSIPSSREAYKLYKSVMPGLYDTIVTKYMMPTSGGGDAVDAVGTSI